MAILFSIWIGGYIATTAWLVAEDLELGNGLPSLLELLIPLLWPAHTIKTIFQVIAILTKKQGK